MINNLIGSSARFIYSNTSTLAKFLNKSIVARLKTIFSSVIGKTFHTFSSLKEKDWLITYNKHSERINLYKKTTEGIELQPLVNFELPKEY